MRFYGIDLVADLGQPRLSWRRLAVLLKHLPRESSFAQVQFGERVRWSDQEHLLALIADAIRVGNWQRQGDKRKPRPDSLPRPGATTAPPIERRTTLTPRQMHARLKDLQRRANARKR